MDRIYPLSDSPDPYTRVYETLLQTLPLDEERRQEAVVFVAFGAAASTRSSLATVFAEEHQTFHDLLQTEIEAASAQGRLQPGWAVEDAVGVIAALVNGLLLEGVNPGSRGNVRIQATLWAGLAGVVMPIGGVILLHIIQIFVQ